LTNDGLAAVIDVHMLDGDFLLTVVAMFSQRLNLSGIRPRELRSMG
jgi:hypothetical protein